MPVPFFVRWITTYQLWHEPRLEAWIVYTVATPGD